jgi:hypothetical protein
MGVDGRIFPVGTKPTDTDSMFANDGFPVQVKQTDKVGPPPRLVSSPGIGQPALAACRMIGRRRRDGDE